MLDEAHNFGSGIGREYVLSTDDHILDERGRHDAQPNFAVDSPESQVINLVSERGNVGTLAGIHINCEYVLSLKVDVRSQIKRKWRVSTLVFS